MDFDTADPDDLGRVQAEAMRCKDAGRHVAIHPDALLALVKVVADHGSTTLTQLRDENRSLGRLLRKFIAAESARLRAERKYHTPKRQAESPRVGLAAFAHAIGVTDDGLAGPSPSADAMEAEDRHDRRPEWYPRSKRGRGEPR